MMKLCTRWVFVCCLGLSVWVVTPTVQADIGQVQLAPIGQQSFGTLLENKSYFLGKKGLLLPTSALGSLRQASSVGSIVLLVILPITLGAIVSATAIIGGLIALGRGRGRLAWGIFNLVLAGCGLIGAVALLALGAGAAALLPLLATVIHGAIGIPAVYLAVTRYYPRGVNARPLPEDSPSMASFRLQSITPAGVAFSF